jgi:DNA mismatch repair protein MutS
VARCVEQDADVSFQSILGPGIARRAGSDSGTPSDCLTDLNLDQLFDWIIASRKEYDLLPFFLSPLRDLDTIEYRHEVIRDLENKHVIGAVKGFADSMRLMRRKIEQSAKLHDRHQKRWWLVDAIEAYCAAARTLLSTLQENSLNSRGFRDFCTYLRDYVASPTFHLMAEQASQLKSSLARIRYCFLIHGSGVSVRRFDAEPDYSAAVERTFAKFAQNEAENHLATFQDEVGMNHVESSILELVARLHPEPFAALEAFCLESADFLDSVIGRFDNEIQFYIAYLEFIGGLTRSGLSFCLPTLTRSSKNVFSRDGFDLALARKLVLAGSRVVCNDFELLGPETAFIVSGANQGGKTTFARMFGQLHYLGSLGLPVPGSSARLFLFDGIFTHFEREESVTNLRSKLEDDLLRLHAILEHATPDSVIILNESFGSTSSKDAAFLGRVIMDRILTLDALCVYVTFVTELAALSSKTVSVVSMTTPGTPASRTFKIVRQPADGCAHAVTVAEAYGLTYDALKKRLAR